MISFKVSAYGFAYNLHGVLEGLDGEGEVVDDLVLGVEPLLHLVLKLLTELHEFDHGCLLELLHVLVLLLQLSSAIVLELPESE